MSQFRPGPSRLGTSDTEMKVPSAENLKPLATVSPFRPAVGQNMVLTATSAARNYVSLSNFDFHYFILSPQ